MLSWKQSQFSHCSLWNYVFPVLFWNNLNLHSVVFETVCLHNLLKQSHYCQCQFVLKKKSEFLQYCVWNTSSFLFQCCLETILIAHCCFWNSISFLNFVFEAVSVYMMFSLKQSHFPSTVFEAISVCLTSPVLSLKQSQFPQYCLWNKIDFPIVVFWNSLKFPRQSEFPILSLEQFQLPHHCLETVLLSSVLSFEIKSGSIVLFLKQHWYPPKNLHQSLLLFWNSFTFPSVVFETISDFLLLFLKQWWCPQKTLHQSSLLSWNSFTFPSVVFETISGSLELFLEQRWAENLRFPSVGKEQGNNLREISIGKQSQVP